LKVAFSCSFGIIVNAGHPERYRCGDVLIEGRVDSWYFSLSHVLDSGRLKAHFLLANLRAAVVVSDPLQRAAALRRGVGEIACPDVVGQVDLELTVDAVTIATASFVHAIVKDRFWSTEVDRDCAFLIRAQGVGFVAVLASPALITFCGIANAAVVLGRKVETWDRKNWLVDVLASQVYVWSRMGAVCRAGASSHSREITLITCTFARACIAIAFAMTVALLGSRGWACTICPCEP